MCVVHIYTHKHNNTYMEENISITVDTRFVYVEGGTQINDQKQIGYNQENF